MYYEKMLDMDLDEVRRELRFEPFHSPRLSAFQNVNNNKNKEKNNMNTMNNNNSTTTGNSASPQVGSPPT